jgi:predicted nucleic acid-binding protein
VKDRVYLETTVISYLTARPSRDVVVAGHQQTTSQWWDARLERFEVVVSQLVLQEAQAGDPDAAKERTHVLESLEILEVTEEALGLAKKLIEKRAIPREAAEDALHIAVAAVNGVSYLLTWNLKHIANAAMRSKIERVCREQGIEPPIICTPEELLED